MIRAFGCWLLAFSLDQARAPRGGPICLGSGGTRPRHALALGLGCPSPHYEMED
jgi:hypothetical protein